MATAYHINVGPKDTGLIGSPQNEETASRVTHLLQKDMQDHNVFFNASRFHDHIVHHLLALYGTGGTSQDLDKAYDANASYQLPAKQPDEAVVANLKNWKTSECKYLGGAEHYADFLLFFQDEIRDKGWQAVVAEFLFQEDDRADDMMQRLFAGILHPLIQLMYGIEWGQPAIVAEALAQTAVHRNTRGPLLSEIERSSTPSSDGKERVVLPELYEEVQREDVTAELNGGDEDRLSPAFLDILRRVRVKEGEVRERTAEMLHTIAWVCGACAFHPPHVPKWDFFLIHHLNASLFFVSSLRHAFLSDRQRARMLEYKIRFDLIEYVARGKPPLQSDALRAYPLPKEHTAESMFPRYHEIVDDGHTIKVVRALVVAQSMSDEFEGARWVRVRGEEWLRVHNLLLKAVGRGNPRWVFAAGFDESWDKVPLALTM